MIPYVSGYSTKKNNYDIDYIHVYLVLNWELYNIYGNLIVYYITDGPQSGINIQS
jgi:hypothetical protein